MCEFSQALPEDEPISHRSSTSHLTARRLEARLRSGGVPPRFLSCPICAGIPSNRQGDGEGHEGHCHRTTGTPSISTANFKWVTHRVHGATNVTRRQTESSWQGTAVAQLLPA